MLSCLDLVFFFFFFLSIPSDDRDQPSVQDLRMQLENGKDEQKIEAMKTILTIMLNGDPLNQLLMHVIRFVMPSKNKALKKLLLIYWEVCPRTDAEGKLKPEMRLMWCVIMRKTFLVY